VQCTSRCPLWDIARCQADVRFGSKSDIALGPRHVRFTPESRHCGVRLACPLSAKSGSRERLPSVPTASSESAGTRAVCLGQPTSIKMGTFSSSRFSSAAKALHFAMR
jgi:hypothetical protein